MRSKRDLLVFLAVCALITYGMVYSTQAETHSTQPDMSTPVYYNPDGGKNFHGDQNCRSVKKRYLPLSSLALADLDSSPYDALTPCTYCSPPPKSAILPDAVLKVGEGNPIDPGVAAAKEIDVAHFAQADVRFPNAPAISAESAILYDLSSHQILYEKNALQRCEPASMTKLLTVLTAYANGGENIRYTVGDEIGLIGGNSSIAYLRKGNVLSFHTMVDAVLLPSGNDAAYTMAVHVARHLEGESLTDEDALAVFAKRMNETAEALGCTDSHFVSVDGYPIQEHYSTAYDMLRIASAAAKTPLIEKSVARSRAYHVFLSKREVVWETTNLLLKKDSGYYYAHATGMKTGSTGDMHHLTASAEKDGTNLIAILFNADSDEQRFQDAIALFEYGFGR